MSSPRPPAAPPDGAGAGELGEQQALAELLAACDVELVRAPNPGALTLSGTNTWLFAREPTWVIDPGPAIEEHLARLRERIDARGGLGGIALTHDHHDHSDALGALRETHPAPLAAGRKGADVALGEVSRFGPFQALATPGHAPDHYALLAGGACFTGDAVLGSGSVFISPYPGAMAGYLGALQRLRAREDFSVLCPGHGPPVWDAKERLEDYLAHRLERERALLGALGEGRRTIDELLDAVWSDVPGALRPAATFTLAAHLDKLEEEQLVPDGVERPHVESIQW